MYCRAGVDFTVENHLERSAATSFDIPLPPGDSSAWKQLSHLSTNAVPFMSPMDHTLYWRSQYSSQYHQLLLAQGNDDVLPPHAHAPHSQQCTSLPATDTYDTL